ncbi:MAG: signal peptide peptidase SppA [Paludibacter sp.]|nr:signal peptide peptidase SppA [Paludibacter sp.]
MKQFLKFTLATITGIVITSVVGLFIMMGIFGAIASSSDSPVKIKSSSIYQLDLKGQLVDRYEEDPFALFAEAMNPNQPKQLGLDEVLLNIDKAKNDTLVKGIYLKGGSLIGGMASIKEIRDALVDFKARGKFIVAYADTYLQSNYYLASVADKLLVNPSGMVDFRGISSEVLFLKNTLDKLGIEMQVVKVGTYKSAVEPYIETKMSEANREQVTAYTTSIWNTMLGEISAARGISVEQLNAYADEMMTMQPVEKLLAYKLVDSLVYADEADSILTSYVKDYKLLTHNSMTKVVDKTKFSKDKVAVIYAVGGIDDGSGTGIVSDKLVKTINEVIKDDMVKAVVLRVSSPGGSAYGSEQIWHALMNLKKEKPLIVSMGDYAASGGYYIAVPGDTVVAQPNTITGSIGIFGLIPNIEGLNNKLGLNYDGVKTNAMSDAPSVNRAFKPEERALMQAYVERGYELFVKRCADGRSKTTDEIKALAEGRVYTGEDALRLGLVDVLAGLDDAILIAAEKAGLSDYNVKEFPAKESFQTRLMKSFGEEAETRLLKMQLGEHYKLVKQVKQLQYMNGIQARMPYELRMY